MAWDVLSMVTKTAWDVLSRVANLCRMFCRGCKKVVWDALLRDVLSGSPAYYVSCIYSIALQNNFIMEANTMNPDQTAPKGAV